MKKSYLYSLSIPQEGLVLPCNIIFSDRKSISIQIKKDASIQVRAPFYAGKRQIEAFIEDKRDWIYKNHAAMLKRSAEAVPLLTPAQERQAAELQKRLIKVAHLYFPKRCEELKELTGGCYTKITIRNQKTRWGSCSQTGTLSFNYRLMMAPPAVIDYVIVHELCHLTHMNHSKDFWNMVGSILPDYARSRQWLKEHGHELTEAHYLFSLI